MTQHLNEEEFADLLAGEASRETQGHLDTCEACRQEVGRTAAAIGSFKTLSLLWADAQPAVANETPARSTGLLLHFPRVLSTAAAAGLVVCGILGGVYHLADRHDENHKDPTVASSNLAEDNRLLLAIHQELSTQEPSPRDVYKIGENTNVPGSGAGTLERE